MASDVQVIDPYRSAQFFHMGPDGAVVLGGFDAIGQNLQAGAKVFDDQQVVADTAAFLRAVQEFRQRDGRNGHATGMGVEFSQHLHWTPFQDVDDDVGVQEVPQHSKCFAFRLVLARAL